ncbi:MAG: hypothetical protein HY769_04890 [Candidatus Stahlbacteria bacterium]|nr:hypothetical protein [Candidatus Stahlbacteria bacterium]
MENRKCPDCEGELVKSKTYAYGETAYFWQKPWGKPWFKFAAIGGNLKLFPWACMGCGRVFFYFDEKEFEVVKMEYQKKRVGL